MPEKNTPFPPQHQEKQPALETEMTPKPQQERAQVGTGKLRGKVALITGADSGIGRATAILFAREGADISVVYYDEHEDARETERQVKEEGRRCLLIAGDIGDEAFCNRCVRDTVNRLGKLDILVNNAAVHYPQDSIQKIDSQQLERTFRTNILAVFYLTKAALNHIPEGGAIINTASVVAYQGHGILIDYAATKGALVAFTRSLALSLAPKKIRVNAVAPGPVWTPLITSYDPQKVATFGEDTPLGRAAQPAEIAPSFLFLATEDSSYITGQVLHPNGGRIVNG